MYETFGIFLLESLVKTLDQIFCYIANRKQGKHSGVEKLYKKFMWFSLTWDWEACTLCKRE